MADAQHPRGRVARTSFTSDLPGANDGSIHEPGGVLVSVVMPFKDAAPFLTESVVSVLAQTCPTVELVMVDDGGTDGSAAMAHEFAAAHPGQVRVVAHPARGNLGIGPSRALGITECRGEVVAFLDADDVWEPEHVADGLRLLATHPEADMVCGRVWSWRSWANPGIADRLSKLAFAPGVVIPATRLLSAVLRDGGTATAMCALMVRRRALDGCIPHLERFPGMYEDQVLNSWLQLRSVAVMSGATSAWYRQHAGSFSATEAAGAEQHDSGRPAFLDWLRRQFEELAEPDAEVGRLLTLALRDCRSGPPARPRRRAERLRAAVPPVAARAARLARRALSLSVPAMDEERVQRLLFRHGADIRGDILQLGPCPALSTACATVREVRPWLPATEGVRGPHHPLADLPSAQYSCAIVACAGFASRGADLGLRHLRRTLREGGVLLLLLAEEEASSIEQQLREVFGWDAVRVDRQYEPRPRFRPLVLLRAVTPVAGR